MEKLTANRHPKMSTSLPRGFWLAIGVIVLAALLLPLMITQAYMYATSPYVRTFMGGHMTPDLAEISKCTRLTFPPSAKLVGAELRRWLSGNIVAKIEIDGDDVEEFVASVPSPHETSTEDRLWIRTYDNAPRWWDPGCAEKFVAVAYSWSSPDGTRAERGYRDERMCVLIELHEPEQAVIYLDWTAE